MNKKSNLLKLVLSSLVILILATVFFLQKKSETSGPTSKVIFEAKESMMFHRGSLVKSKYCDSITSIVIRVVAVNKINYKKEPELRVTINGEIDLDNRRKVTKSTNSDIYAGSEKDWLGNKQKFWGGMYHRLKLPSYQKFKKEKIPILVELIVDGKAIDHITDTIQYVEDNVEITSFEKVNFRSYGNMRPPGYFENETLYAVNKKGTYSLDKKMITTISREKNQFKIVTDSPPGYLTHRYDTTYKIPVPAFPQNVEYADLSTELIEGKYLDLARSTTMYKIDEEKIGSFVAHKYDHQPIGNKKTISYNKCHEEELASMSFKIPAGIFISFETYPPEIDNNYITSN